MDKEKILLTIAARGGSKGVKDKNIRELCGLPLITHTILQAKKWGKADKIICSTDSGKIAQIAKEYGAEIPFMRPAELATDICGKLEVLRHALMTVESQSGEKFSIIVDLDPTAPVRKIDDIENCLQLFLEKRPKALFSVTRCRKNPYFNMIEIGPRGYAVMSKKTDFVIKRRQDAPQVYDVNASIYVYERGYLLDNNSDTTLSDRTLVYVMDKFSAFDIDSESDFQFIEFLVTKGLVKL